MVIDYQTLRNWRFEDRVDHYTVRDCMLYALGLGYGSDPLDEAELRYVHEDDTQVVPTLLATVGAPAGWAADPATHFARRTPHDVSRAAGSASVGTQPYPG